MDSRHTAAAMRPTTYPGTAFLRTIGIRPRARRYSCARATLATDVRAPGTSSTSGMSSGGLRGCATRQRSWWRQRANSSVGGSPLDELVSSAWGAATCSRAPNSFCLPMSSSLIASITQSASCTACSRLRPSCSSSSPRSVGLRPGTPPLVLPRPGLALALPLFLAQVHDQPLLLELQRLGTDQRGDRQHVVHDAAVQPLGLFVELDVEAQGVVDPAGERRARVREPCHLLRAEHRFARHVEPDHLGWELR